MNMPEN